MQSFSKFDLAVSGVLVFAWSMQAQFAVPTVNQWTGTADMAAPRAEACSVRFPDGRVLVMGGRGDSGALNSAEMYRADGTFSAVSPMAVPRASAACAVLLDGRVLIAGGNNGSEALRSAEVFDAAANQWTSVGEMTASRSGHTAAVQPGGAILLIGGDEEGTVEAYLTDGRFAHVGKLSAARSEYAVIRLVDGRIMIAGGKIDGNAVPAVDIFDPADLTIRRGADMLSARRSLAAAALYDGTVMLIGGYDVNGMPLSTTEIYDPAKGVSIAGPPLRSARAGHAAYLLPNNGRVLIAGGVDANGPLAGTEVYSPWTGKMELTGSMLHARAHMSASLLRRGAVVVAGGKQGFYYTGSSEVYSFATVETGQLDYAPGSVATITGHGWKPGETVVLIVTAFPLDRHRAEFTASAVADGAGQIQFPGFKMDTSHVSARFMATAVGSESQAQTPLTNASPDTTTMTLTVDSASNPFGASPAFSGHILGAIVNDVNTGSVSLQYDGAFAITGPSNSVDGVGNYSVTPAGTLIPPGLHQISGAYSGGTNGVLQQWLGSSTTSPISYTVSAAVTVTSTVSPAGPYRFGDYLTITANVAGTIPGSGSPNSGTVTFVDTADNNTVIGVRPVVAGTASVLVNNLRVLPIPHSIVAQYVNTIPGYLNANAGMAGLSIGRAISLYQIAFSPTNSPTVGQTITLIFTVQTIGGITPTGNVNFRVNGTSVSPPLALVNGQASFAYGLLRAGAQKISVTYSGDSNYSAQNPSQATTLNVGLASVNTSIRLDGSLVAPAQDYYSAHPVLKGDTNLCTQTAATYAGGGAAGTSLLNRNDGKGNVVLSGKILCTLNDGGDGATDGNIWMFTLDVLDMTSMANTTATVLNKMTSFGPGAAVNSPAGWNGQCATGYNTLCNWKSSRPISVKGWIVLPVFRQTVGPWDAGDATFVVSPDGGAHWCNPYTYFHRSGSPGCDVLNWKADGDAPLDPSAAQYNDPAHSSMMWKDRYPFNGTTNVMGYINFIDYCQDNSCTGMPDGADSYLYAFGNNGQKSREYLARVPKDIIKILDPSQWQWYSQTNYSPTNTGDGTSWTSTIANATVMMLGSPADSGFASTGGLTNPMGWLLAPNYLCANGGCAYVAAGNPDYIYGGPVHIALITFPRPWGPYQHTSEASTPLADFWYLMRWTAWAPDSTAYHLRMVAMSDSPEHVANTSMYWQTYDLQLGAAPVVMPAIARTGLAKYFDMWFPSYSNVYEAAMWSNDLSTPLPETQLLGCFTDPTPKCGLLSPGKSLTWNTSGIDMADAGYAARFELRKLSNGPDYDPVVDTTFTGDTSWTVTTAFSLTDPMHTRNPVLGVGGIGDDNLTIYASFDDGKIGVSWHNGSYFYASTPSILTGNTPVQVTVTKSAGQLTSDNVGNVPGSILHVYINGADTALVGGGTSLSTRTVSPGALTVGYGTDVPRSFNGTFYGIGWYTRALSASEVVSNYAALKAALGLRAVLLP